MKPQVKLRGDQFLTKPVAMEPAFDNPEGIEKLIRKGGPYKTLAAVHRNVGETTGGWFRNFWALGGKVVFEGAEPYFNNQRFIDTAKETYRAEVIRPVAMMTNLNLPASGAPFHLDLPFYRGAENKEVPSWMLTPMRYSNLFQDWAIPIASAVTWFYEGEGGEFEYWPDGLDHPSLTESPPFTNRCVLADNEYMFHRVGAIGPVSEHGKYDDIGYDALLELGPDDRWHVKEDGKTRASFDYGQVRISILWKAHCFKDERLAAIYDDHSDDLTAERVRDIFSADLKRRGVDFREPGDFATDLAWKKVITENYAPPEGGQRY
ncbi:hypothetical protein [Sneathiella sp.]|jgi:hypothetical protein|uniref:hypothetical protein n=1 Tax=Sneathiella sp. TaxID=1964365 RepID=UPI0039E27794